LRLRGTLQAHPCVAHPRHPWLEKPPEPQPDTPNHFYVIPSLKVKEQEQRAKARSKATVILLYAEVLAKLQFLLLLTSPFFKGGLRGLLLSLSLSFDFDFALSLSVSKMDAGKKGGEV